MAADPKRAMQELVALHERVDREAGDVARGHGADLQCRRGCHACCVDELTVFEIEAQRIRDAHPELLATGEPHPRGACAFLDAEGACRVYAERPYVCRTQGLPLRWLAEDEAGEIVEQRDVCPLNLEGVPLDSLDERACWTIGPVELALGALQERFAGPARTRVALRDLFTRASRGR